MNHGFSVDDHVYWKGRLGLVVEVSKNSVAVRFSEDVGTKITFQGRLIKELRKV